MDEKNPEKENEKIKQTRKQEKVKLKSIRSLFPEKEFGPRKMGLVTYPFNNLCNALSLTDENTSGNSSNTTTTTGSPTGVFFGSNSTDMLVRDDNVDQKANKESVTVKPNDNNPKETKNGNSLQVISLNSNQVNVKVVPIGPIVFGNKEKTKTHPVPVVQNQVHSTGNNVVNMGNYLFNTNPFSGTMPNQELCAIKGCENPASQRLAKSLKMEYKLDPSFEEMRWTKICDNCYYRDRYQSQKKKTSTTAPSKEDSE